MNTIVYAGHLFVQYGQFYLLDRARQPLAPTDYDDQDDARGIKEADGITVILPPRNGLIHLTVELVDQMPCLGSEWQRISVGTITTSSDLALVEWPDQIRATIAVSPGTCAVMYAYAGVTEQVEADERGDDVHRLWVARHVGL